jgi:DNA-binding protein HU-beta
MNKSELVEHIADQSGLSKAGATRAISVILNSITKSLKKGEPVSIAGFGTFAVRKRSPRMGRNPKTGEAIKIAASKTIKFSAGKTFKDIVNRR